MKNGNQGVRFRSAQGTLTLEACIAYTCFAFVMFTLLLLIKIIFTYGVVQHAINQAAKEFASYSYLYALTLQDVDKAMGEATSAGQEYFNKSADQLATTYSAASSLMGSAAAAVNEISEGDISALSNSLQSATASLGDLQDSLPGTKETLAGIISDPKKAFMSLVGVLAVGVSENTKTLICAEIVRAMSVEFIDYQEGTAAGADERLRKLRVIGGLRGLDFSASRFFPNGGMDIDIVVCYSIDPLVPLKLLPDLNLVNRVYIKGWGRGYFSSTGDSKEEENKEITNSIWNDANDLNRGTTLQKEAGLRNLPRNFPVFSAFENGIATSSMSIDLRAKTYQTQSQLNTLIINRCKKINEFTEATNGGVTLTSKDITQRELVIIIPPSTEAIGEIDQTLLNKALAKARAEYPNIVIRVIEMDMESLE